MKSLLAVGASLLLFLIGALTVVKDLSFKIVSSFIYRPLRKVSSVFFHTVLVKLYTWYLRVAKKFGFEGRKRKFLLTLNQKLVHFLVIFLTIFLLLVNLNGKNKVQASTYIDKAHDTILADLVKSEFEGLSEEDRLVIETFDREAVISSAQQTYLDNLGGFRPQARVSMDEDVDGEEEFENMADEGIIQRPNIATTKITKQDRTETISYEVSPGDTISTIAEKFEVSVYTILWENDLSSYSIIRPGDKLSILPMTGLSHEVASNETVSSIAKKYSVEEDLILEQNKLAKNDALKIGQKLLVPGGRKISAPAPKPQTYTGFTAIKNIVTTPSTESGNSNKMAWPANATRITQYYSWRHHGLDIAAKTGTALYAADSGTVEVVGWGTGYGNQIVINHGGGKKTRYAHMSKFYVSKGDKVTKGMPIGEMGSTGWSTGPHVHFEVIINGTKYNPLNYIR